MHACLCSSASRASGGRALRPSDVKTWMTPSAQARDTNEPLPGRMMVETGVSLVEITLHLFHKPSSITPVRLPQDALVNKSRHASSSTLTRALISSAMPNSCPPICAPALTHPHTSDAADSSVEQSVPNHRPVLGAHHPRNLVLCNVATDLDYSKIALHHTFCKVARDTDHSKRLSYITLSRLISFLKTLQLPKGSLVRAARNLG
jgi:hypothetical protein